MTSLSLVVVLGLSWIFFGGENNYLIFGLVLHFLDLRMLKNYTSSVFFEIPGSICDGDRVRIFKRHEKNGPKTRGWFKASLKKMEKQAVHAIDRKATGPPSCGVRGFAAGSHLTQE